MNFGFSYAGLIFLLMLTVSNIIRSRNKPAVKSFLAKNGFAVIKEVDKDGHILLVTEKAL